MKSVSKFFSALIVDHDVHMREYLIQSLSKQFVLLEAVATIEEAEQLRQRCHFDVIIMEVNLPQRSGLDWTEVFEGAVPRADIIYLSSQHNIQQSIKALQLGAADFILKPFTLDVLNTSIERCLSKRIVRRQHLTLNETITYDQPSVITGQSHAIKSIQRLLEQVAPTQVSTLIEGESGTGKELVAKQLHVLSGRTGEFVPINCGSIAAHLLESELFGHEIGAFAGAEHRKKGLFETAHKGTLFLDEIGEMPLNMQSALLKVLEDRKIKPVGYDGEIDVDVRVVAATNRKLEDDVEAGQFRSDLYYLLNVINITLPPLRERPEDIVALTHSFTNEIALELGLNDIVWSHGDLEALKQYHWPGNIRELRNIISRCILLGKLPADYWQLNTPAPEPVVAGYPLEWSAKAVEKEHILKVVESVGGNKSIAAKQLGLSRKTLERKYKDWFE
ncbi:sigma-54-dependent transcriptional regulator [Shewanella intestini]|uniref:Sigma-54-dependent Fis family transcriptional regulator n=1 Tax=Shewanella intestini TaxID=2017544 RepID=A0ABS5HZV8_9GAMM|nr:MULTISPECIES: sigma-54 dependent transcriptional regulator [Shewanella]MBR9727318.1 sigma-54-dependent Fis family transcriptional regulator [Shewanella intestini]MRG35632.1 response regulator [Shewanella sp. XMDDZSB0408]